jgi:hypothetical protein
MAAAVEPQTVSPRLRSPVLLGHARLVQTLASRVRGPGSASEVSSTKRLTLTSAPQMLQGSLLSMASNLDAARDVAVLLHNPTDCGPVD